MKWRGKMEALKAANYAKSLCRLGFYDGSVFPSAAMQKRIQNSEACGSNQAGVKVQAGTSPLQGHNLWQKTVLKLTDEACRRYRRRGGSGSSHLGGSSAHLSETRFRQSGIGIFKLIHQWFLTSLCVGMRRFLAAVSTCTHCGLGCLELFLSGTQTFTSSSKEKSGILNQKRKTVSYSIKRNLHFYLNQSSHPAFKSWKMSRVL